MAHPDEPNILVKTALDSVIQYLKGGASPTDALQKTAEEYDLNHNYIERVGSAMNVALHYNHFKTAKDRSTDFPIADIPAVISKQYSFEEKNEKKASSEAFQSSEVEKPSPDLVKYMYRPQYKQAMAEISKEIIDDRGILLKTAFTRASNYLVKLSQELDNAKTEKVGASINLDSAFSNLVNHFSVDPLSRTSFDEVESQVYSKYGEEATPWLDFIYKTAGLKEERGVHDKSYKFFDTCKEAEMFDKFLTSTKEYTKALAVVKEAEETFESEKNFRDEIFREVGGIKKKADEPNVVSGPITNPVPDEKIHTKINQSVAVDESDPVLKKIQENLKKKEKTIVTPSITTEAKTAAHNLNEAVETALSAVDRLSHPSESKKSPFATSALENMQRQTMLQELIITDSILSHIAPVKVLKAYEQIARLAPQMSLEKDVVRGLLRQMVESQAFSDYDADRLTQADLNRMKHKLMLKGDGEKKGKD
jgi:hypothetical protein